jgi:hypothetical protein
MPRKRRRSRISVATPSASSSTCVDSISVVCQEASFRGFVDKGENLLDRPVDHHAVLDLAQRKALLTSDYRPSRRV